MSNDFPWLQSQLERDLLSDRPSTALTLAEREAFAAITAGQQLPTAWSDRLQAQGDLLVLPWPENTDPVRRMGALASAKPLPPSGVHLANGSHQLQALDPEVLWAPEPASSRLTLGTLVVPDGCLALLGHGTHEDLHIGPGVYLIRRQREARLPDLQIQPLPSSERRNPQRRSLLGLIWDVVVD
ncbi:MAG TPA: hypothetical protein VFP72_14580 [Kineosporiaceae bacterium]|nr:hypothetical protein [Kineosporiaceae bacterium]